MFKILHGESLSNETGVIKNVVQQILSKLLTINC
jgi:hypothetical protein